MTISKNKSTYEVYLEKTAEKDLNKIPADRFSQIVSAIKDLKNNPRPVGCCKIKGSHNDWRIRIGPYRVIYEVHHKAKEVKIMRVRHRREVYR